MPALSSIVPPRERDLGSFTVRRILPGFPTRHVGPFVFVDHMGPLALPRGEGVDVRPHPHIGLATVTWLWEGALMHRDSLGTVQRIAPGEVNWMTAGRGIVHSERSAAACTACRPGSRFRPGSRRPIPRSPTSPPPTCPRSRATTRRSP